MALPPVLNSPPASLTLNTSVETISYSLLHDSLGQPERAIELILEDYALRDPWFPWYIKDPLLADLRSDPRIAEIFRELKLPLD